MSVKISTFDDPKFGPLALYQWPCDAPIGTLLFCHGVLEHLGRYERLANACQAHHIALLGIDHPGHGKSYQEGLLGDVQTEHLSDLADIQVRLAKQLDQPVVLAGHSMGAFVATLAAVQGLPLAGLALLSSAGNLNPKAALGYPLLRAACWSWQKGGLPEALCFLGFNYRTERRTKRDWLAFNQQAVEANIADPLCFQPLPARTALALGRAGKQVFSNRHLAQLPDQYPILLTAGKGDPVSHYGKAVARVARNLARHRQHPVSLWLYPNARHEIIHEQEGAQYANDVAQWAADCLTGRQVLAHLSADSERALG